MKLWRLSWKEQINMQWWLLSVRDHRAQISIATHERREESWTIPHKNILKQQQGLQRTNTVPFGVLDCKGEAIAVILNNYREREELCDLWRVWTKRHQWRCFSWLTLLKHPQCLTRSTRKGTSISSSKALHSLCHMTPSPKLSVNCFIFLELTHTFENAQ